MERKIRFDFDGQNGSEHLEMARLSDSDKALRFKGPNFLFDVDRSEISYIQLSTWLSRYARHGHLPFGGDTITFRKRQLLAGHAPDRDINDFGKFVSFFRSELPLPDKPSFIVKVIDPGLSPRQRFYDSVSSILPGGDDSEMRLFLTETGKKLNLWNDVSYQKNKVGDFEIMIGTQSGPRNLIDVGYGVHSILPLAHVMYDCQPGTIFLLQQPEVHLHPSAQANLAQLMVESEHDFLIETHSEHFMDRFRICVMKGQLSPEDLSIVYFEPGESGESSTIYNLAVDANANLLNAPKSYKQFFMSETEKLLGFDNL